ncbi:MAG: hypothetical protein JNG89_11350, partial [Planctomycetaceae bacterium]|nr:hypothetical protein [Planctomycetaceae bacterium]
MALHIACLLLSLLVYVPFCAAQSADGILLDSLDAESGVNVEFSNNVLMLLDRDPVDLQLFQKIDDLFRDQDSLHVVQGREFPFSPRLVGQHNYDIHNASAPPRTFNFVIRDSYGFIDDGVMLKNDNGILRAVPPVPFRGAFIVRTSGTGDGSELEFVIGDNGAGTLQAVPANTGILVVEHCDEAACDLPGESADDEPIDVVLADDEPADDCGSPETVSAEAGNGVTFTGDADCVHLLPLPAADLTSEMAPTLNVSSVFRDIAGSLMLISPDTVHVTGLSGIPSAGAAEAPPPPAPLPTRTVVGLLAPEPMPPEPEAIAAVPGLSPFGFIETENGRPMPAAVEACQQAEPPLKAKVEHLLEAARHLAGAGYEEEAKIFRVEAEAIQNASHRLLAE